MFYEVPKDFELTFHNNFFTLWTFLKNVEPNENNMVPQVFSLHLNKAKSQVNCSTHLDDLFQTLGPMNLFSS
jgi:hypothetical protein